MSSAAYINWDLDTDPLPLDEWEKFCREYEINYSPETNSKNVYYFGGRGAVECHFGDQNFEGEGPLPAAHLVYFSTYHFGEAMPDVARIAFAAWKRWGGSLSADPEIRAHMGWEVEQ